MNRHVGASFTLSVLVVVFFAVVLYQPEHARRRPPHARKPAAPSADSLTSAPSPTPGIPLSEATDAPLGDSSSWPGRGAVSATDDEESAPNRGFSAAAAARPIANASGRSNNPDSPAMIQIGARRGPSPSPWHSSFTQVSEGESLTDVAVRVYGTPKATRKLWLANRDIIDRRDSALRVGMHLRTP